MKLSLRNLFAAAGLLVAATTGARAEEISLAPNFEPFAAPEVTLVSHCTDGCNNGCNNGCTSGCDSGCNSCCTSRHVGRDFWVCNDRCGGVVGGLEFLFLEPFGEDGIVGPGLIPGGADIGLEPAFRAWAGWENTDGLGARLRYFQIDADDVTIFNALAVDYRYIDAEMTQAVAFRRSSMQLAGGVRYAEAQNAAIIGPIGAGAPLFAAANEFQGLGLTFGVGANRDISSNGALRMTANARWSLLYGENDVLFGGAFAGTLEDELMQVIELQVGPQLRIPLRSGGYLTAFGGAEAQYWQNGFSTPVPGLSIDTGFAGLATSVGITR